MIVEKKSHCAGWKWDY